MKPAREYPAVIVEIIDGDTLIATADLGFDVWYRVHVRLDGINAREHDAPGGPQARDHLAALAPVGMQVVLQSIGWDKFGGRADGRITLPSGRDLSEQMVADGYAARWNGRGAKPVPPWPLPAT